MSSVAARLEARRLDAEGEGAASKASNATVASVSHAQATAFLADFDAQRKQIEAALAKLDTERTAAAVAAAGSTDPTAATAALAAVAQQIGALQATTSAHSHLLPPYDLRATGTAIAALDEALVAAQLAHQPKKKFAFKKKTVPAASTAAAAAASASPAVAAPSASPSPLPAAVAEHMPPEDPRTSFYRKSGAVLVKCGGSIDGVDVVLSQLRDCVVLLLGSPSALRCHALVNCHVYCGPCSGSVLIYGASDCTFHLAARQLRIHDTHATTFRLHLTSSPIIEHTDTSGFGAFDFAYPDLAAHMAHSGLMGKPSKHAQVEDFNWLRTQQSPNWFAIADDAQGQIPAVTLTDAQAATLMDMRDDQTDDAEQQSRLQKLVQELGIKQ